MGLPVSGESATHNQSEDTDEPENPLRYFFTCANYCRGTERLRNDEEIETYYYGKIDALPARYARTNGTSFSGPALLGAAACVWQAHPGWTASEMKSALISSSLKKLQWSDLRAGLVSGNRSVPWQIGAGGGMVAGWY